MACEDIEAKLNSLEVQKAELEAELKDLGPESSAAIRAKLNQQLQTVTQAMAATRADLEVCLNQIGPSHAPAPMEILEIRQNPAQPPTGDNWASSDKGTCTAI